MVPWNSASGGFAYIWQSKWLGIIAIKTERTQIHFLSDVLVAVASLDLKVPIRNLKRRQWQQRQKTIGFMSKTNALHVHDAFKYISLTSTTRLPRETSQCEVLWRRWTWDDKFSLLSLNMDKALKNSTPGKVAYIWRIEQFQIYAIKFEKTQIIFLVSFSLPSSSWLLKVTVIIIIIVVVIIFESLRYKRSLGTRNFQCLVLKPEISLWTFHC